MKKLIPFLLLLVCVTAHADSSARIKELIDEAQGLLDKRQQYVQEVQKIDIRIVEIQGAIKELQIVKDEPKNAKTDS